MSLIPTDPDAKKKFFLALFVALAATYGVYHFIYSPKSEEAHLVEIRFLELNAQNNKARATIDQGRSEELQSRLDRYRLHLSEIEQLIPRESDLPTLLDAISVEARRSGVEVSLIQPRSDTQEEHYIRSVYDLGVLGPYHNIALFLTRIASLPRIVTPQDLAITPVSGPAQPNQDRRLEARFSIETYVAPEHPPERIVEEGEE